MRSMGNSKQEQFVQLVETNSPCRGIAVLFMLAAARLTPQGIITTVAGTDFSFPSSPMSAINAPIGYTSAVLVDANGNTYISDSDNCLILRMDRSGILQVVAGNGIRGFSGDGGPATNASLNAPSGLAFDDQGNLLIADTGNDRIRLLTSNGVITTFLGPPDIQNPSSIVVGAGRTFIATGSAVMRLDGAKLTTVLLTDSAARLALSKQGELFVSVSAANEVLKIAANGTLITVIVGNIPVFGQSVAYAIAGYSGDGGPGTSAQLNRPAGIALDDGGNLFIADQGNDVIRKLTPEGIITTAFGSHTEGFSGDGGLAASASFNSPEDLAFDAQGNLYVADSANYRIREVGRSGGISTVAGSGAYRFSGDGSPAVTATFNRLEALTVDSTGTLYIADTYNQRIRKVTKDGIITTFAGTGEAGFSGDDGAATSAQLNYPLGVAVDNVGNVFIADYSNSRIRKVTPLGVITTVAGTGSFDYSGDNGPAKGASLNKPDAVAVDAANNLFIADSGNFRIREVSPAGIISTFAGTGHQGILGDGVPATSADFYSLSDITVGPAGDVYILDFGLLRRVTADGVITTIAGGSFDGVFADALGNVYVADAGENVIRKVGPSGLAITVAGSGKPGLSGDGGPATEALLDAPVAVALDKLGNVFIADFHNNRIREVFISPPQVQVSPSQLQFNAASGGEIPPVQTVSLVSGVAGLASGLTGLTFSALTSASWLRVSPSSGASPRLLEVTVDPTNLPPNTYTGAIAIAAPDAVPAISSVSVTFIVAAGQAPGLAVDTRNLSFSFPKQGTKRSQPVTVSNSGGGILHFAANAGSSGNWLSVSPASGQALPSAPVTLTVIADPAGLGPGTYNGSLSIAGDGDTQKLPVVMTVSNLGQVVLLSQSGLSFTGISLGGVVPPQTFAVRNIGSGVVPWTVSTSLLSGGQNWLQVTPASGSSDAAQSPPSVTVSVSAAGLAEGIYYGLVQVNAPAAANSPQVVTVFLRVLPPGSDAAAVVQPGSMLFTSVTGGESPGSQTLSVYNITANSKSFHAAVSAADPGLNIVALPSDATLDPQQPTQIVLQPFTSGLASGVHSATVTLQFSDGRVQRVNVQVIVSNTGGGSSTTSGNARNAVSRAADATSCTPTKLLPALISLADLIELPTGLPVKLGVYVKDDCGTPVQTGSVTAHFSNGDSPATLIALNDSGLWEGQWLTQNGALSKATVKLHAENAGLTGDQQVSANLLALQQPPAFDQSGISAAFGGSAYAAIAPGSVITIYGTQLAADSAMPAGSPLPGSWLGTQAFISGGNNVLLPLPLYYVSPGQINAIVPYEVQTNTPLELLVQRGTTASQPVSVNVAPAGPALYGGPGAITDYPSNGGANYDVTTSAPAHAGDTLVLFCLGLGAVSPDVTDGGLPVALSQVSGAQVQIGSQTATAVFAGLTSQFPGLYQVNVVVPANTGTGGVVPLAITVAGQTSPPIMIAIQ
jgi:uncharacterized protein (TIGR03437 family)